ncbi:MAG: phage holin family protein [Solirubrobacterales bacterium]
MSAPSTPPPGEQRSESSQSIATAIAEVSERATLLVREEIELAKAEVAEKASKLIRGAVVGAAAGIFVVMALVFALVGCAWLLYYYLPGNAYTYFWGFFAMAVILLLLGALAGLAAARAVKKGAPPVPSMAIEEARKIRETVSSGSDVPAPATRATPASADGAQAAQAGAAAAAEAEG